MVNTSNELAKAINEYNDLIQQVKQIKFWNFILEMQKTISMKALELYSVCLELVDRDLYGYLRSKASIKRFVISGNAERKFYWLKSFDRKSLYDKRRLIYIKELVDVGLLVESNNGFEPRLPDLFGVHLPVPINKEADRLVFNFYIFHNMLKKVLAHQPLREQYNILKLRNLPFYYFDYDELCIIKKELRRDELVDKDVEYLLKYIKVLEYEVGRISYGEIAGEKRETGFFASSIQDVKYHFFL